MKKLLAVTYGVGHVNMVIPVVRELERRGGFDVTVLGLTNAAPVLSKAEIPFAGYQDLLRPGDQAALQLGAELLGDSYNPASGISRDESIAYLGLSYADLIEQLGEAGAKERYASLRRHAFFPIGPMQRAMGIWQPDVVLATSSPKSERAALTVAAQCGIRSVALDDAMGQRPSLFPEFVPAFRADRICAASSIGRDNLMRQGVKAEAIRVTGNPAFDPIAALDCQQARREIRERFQIGDAESVLMYAAEVSPDDAGAGGLLRNLLVARPSLRVLLRRHPSQWQDQLGSLGDALGPRCQLAENQPVHPLLAASDLLLTVASTVALEAILLDCPVLQPGPDLPLANWDTAPHENLPLFRYGASVLVRSLDELTEATDRLLDKENRTALTTKLRAIFPRPGQSAKLIVDEITEIALSVADRR